MLYAHMPCKGLTNHRRRVTVFTGQVEQKRVGIPRNQPCAVQQWQGLIAVNYAARAAGVKKQSTVAEALELCPDLQCVHVEVLDEKGCIHEDTITSVQAAQNLNNRGKACLARYRKASAEVFKIFHEVFPSCVLEKASIDEAYLDLTDEVAKELKKPRPNTSQDIEAALQGSVVIGGQLSPESNFDVRLAVAANLASRLRAQVFKELDFTVSAGISHNKLLAKLASGMNKPDNQTIIPFHTVSSVMRDMPLSKLRNFGGKLGATLESMGCVTAADVQALPYEQVAQAVGDSATYVIDACRGISHEPVKSKTVPKSMLAAKAFPTTTKWEVIEYWLRVLCAELADRMADDSALHNRRPKNLVLHYRKADKSGRFGAGQEKSRSAHLRTCDIPCTDDLVEVARGILKGLPDVMPCNRIAVSTNTFQSLSGSGGGVLGKLILNHKLEKGAAPKPHVFLGDLQKESNVSRSSSPVLNTMNCDGSSKRVGEDHLQAAAVKRALEAPTSLHSVKKKTSLLQSFRSLGSSGKAKAAQPFESRNVAPWSVGAQQAASELREQALEKQKSVLPTCKAMPEDASDWNANVSARDAQRDTTGAPAKPVKQFDYEPSGHACNAATRSSSVACEVIPSDDDLDQDIDVAEQRHILYLIQMEKKKAANALPSSNKGLRETPSKQKSLLSLLNKK